MTGNFGGIDCYCWNEKLALLTDYKSNAVPPASSTSKLLILLKILA
jgi:hypothetical protein